MSENENEEPQFPEDKGSFGGKLPPEPTKSYAGWVTACAFAAVSTLFLVLWQTQTKGYNTAREDLKTEKQDNKLEIKSKDSIIAGLNLDLINCNDNALEDLDKKMKKAESMRLSSFADYAKIEKDIELSKKNAANLTKATKNVNKAIQSQTNQK